MNKLERYWLTNQFGVAPRFPIILYDYSIPHQLCFYTKPGHVFQNNMILGIEPGPEDIIIDCEGRIIKMAVAKGFGRYPKEVVDTVTVEELKRILAAVEIADLESYLVLSSVGEVFELLGSRFDYLEQ